MGGNNVILMKDNLMIQYLLLFMLDWEFVLCCLWSHDAGILVMKLTHILPLSSTRCIIMAAKCFSKACSLYRIVCLSLLLLCRITLSENSPTACTLASQGLNNAYSKGKSWGSCQQFKEVLKSFDGGMLTESALEINFQMPFFY